MAVPTRAVSIPKAPRIKRMRCSAGPLRAPENTTSQVRASPKSPSSLKTPAKSTQAGAGAVP